MNTKNKTLQVITRALALLALCSPATAFSQSWQDDELLAYQGSHKDAPTSADDDIFAAMKALEEVGAIIGDPAPIQAQTNENANNQAVNIDAILLAASKAETPEVVMPNDDDNVAEALLAKLEPTTVQETTPREAESSDLTEPPQQLPATDAPVAQKQPVVEMPTVVPSNDQTEPAPHENTLAKAVESPTNKPVEASNKPVENTVAKAETATNQNDVNEPAKTHNVVSPANKKPVENTVAKTSNATNAPKATNAKANVAPKTETKPSNTQLAVNNNTKSTNKADEVPALTPSSLAMQYVMAVYLVNQVDLTKAVNGRTPTISEIYQYAFSKKLVYQNTKPAIGDLVFFHNAYDRNHDGRWNDWHTQIGIVEAIDTDSTISILLWQNDKIQRIKMNLKYPELHKGKKGQILNTQLRADENNQKGIASKLFGGFANLLGNVNQVTVIDNWTPDMKLK